MIDIARTKELEKLSTKTITELTLKTSEEMGELAEAILSSNGVAECAYKGKCDLDVLEEAVDVIQCAMTVIIRTFPDVPLDVLEEKIKIMYDHKLDKWESKQ